MICIEKKRKDTPTRSIDLNERATIIINKSRLENDSADNLIFNAALVEMSESELARLLDKVEALEEDFRLIPLRKGETVEASEAAQNLLKVWNTEVDRILLDKQATDDQLNTWDNEGGTITNTTPSRRVLVRTNDGKQRLVWAQVEYTNLKT